LKNDGGGGESTLARFARANGWAVAARMVVAVGNFVRFIVFLRLLTPFDFGVAVAAFFTLDTLSVPTEMNFMRALIQQDEEPHDFLDTIWVLKIVRAVLIALVLASFAKPLAIFFKQADSYPVFWMAAILGMVREMQSPAAVRMFRELEYRNMLVFNVVEFAATLGFGVTAVLILKGWRGLMVGVIAGQACWAGVSYLYYPYRPRFRFDFQQTRELFKYGRWITAARLSQFLARQLDSLAVGHMLGPDSLGAYKLAFNIGEAPMGEFSGAVEQVTFPMIARLRGTREERNRVMYWGIAAVLAAGAIYSVILIRWGGPLLVWLFGSNWAGAVAPLRLLCLCGLFQGLLTLAASFFEGIGTPAVSFKLSLVRVVTLAIFVYPLTLWFGNSGAAGAALISVIIPIPFMLLLMRNMVGSAAA